MIAVNDLSEVEIARLYNQFKEQYKSLYSPKNWKYIEENFWTYVHSPVAPDMLMQAYTELGIEPQEGNFYQKHLDKLKSNFDIGCNVLDIASGKIPSFANLIAHEQLSVGKGTVTLYEPLLINTTPKFSNMTLHRTKFTNETRIKEFDLITGIMPCEVTETIIEQACKNKKDFYIAMCGCTHFDYIPWGIQVTPEMYQNYIIDKTIHLLKQYSNGTLVVDKLDDGCPIDYPILYNRKK